MHSQEECVQIERVTPQHNTPSISNDLKDEATKHANQEAPCPIEYAETGLEAEEYAEYCEVSCVA